MSLPDAAVEHRGRRTRRTSAARLICRGLWRKVGPDFDPGWRDIASRLGLVVQSAQLGAARDAARMVPEVLAEIGVPDRPEGLVVPESFAGAAGDGRPLDSLLYGAVVQAKQTARGGESSLEAQQKAGEDWLDMAVATAIADADRGAAQAAMVARPDVAGYVRVLQLPSCDRCLILAGRWYKANADFDRHPFCQCSASPASREQARDMVPDPRDAIREGLVRGLSLADERAILEGADPARVINARRGMYTAGGEKLTRTGKGARRRDTATTPRLRPEAIYNRRVSRAEQIELLKANGYLH